MGCAAVIAAFSPDLRIDLDNIFLTKVIGTGGFGTVFSGLHLEYQFWFAVKRVLKTDVLAHKGGVSMILGELQAWKAIGQHKYIADLHFAIQDKLSCYFLMDLMTGGDLRYYIKRRLILSEPELAFLVAAISSALHHMHSRNVLHRDIKPENIIFDDQGYPYLTDFGVSCICSAPDRTCTLSSGTKQYLAPEVFTKSHKHGPAADFWALGILIYEILFGKRPFHNHVPRSHAKYLDDRAERAVSAGRGAPSAAARSPWSSPLSSLDSSPLLLTLQGQQTTVPPSLSPAKDTCICMLSAASVTHTRSPLLAPKDSRGSSDSPSCASPKTGQSENLLSPRGSVPRILPPLTNKELSFMHSAPTAKLMGKLSSSAKLVALLKLDEQAARFVPPGRRGSKLSQSAVFPIPDPYLDEEISRAGPSVINGGNGPCAENPVDKMPSSGEESPIQRQQGNSFEPADGIVQDRPRDNQVDDCELYGRGFSIEIEPMTDCCDAVEDDSSGASVGPPVLHSVPPLPESLRVQIPFFSHADKPVSTGLRSFLEGLLDTRPEYRLGGWENYSKLVEHPWFSKTELNWQKVEEKTAPPPFIPDRAEVQAALNKKHGNADIDESTIDMFLCREPLSRATQERFDEFHHIATEYLNLFPLLAVQCEGKGSGVKSVRSTYPSENKTEPKARFPPLGTSRVFA